MTTIGKRTIATVGVKTPETLDQRVQAMIHIITGGNFDEYMSKMVRELQEPPQSKGA